MMSTVVHKENAALPLKGKVLVVGLGKTGLSCARFLQRQGFEVAITDSRQQPPGLDQLQQAWPDLPVFLGGFARKAFEAADSLVVSPGVPLEESLIVEAMQQGKPVLGDIELFARYAKAPVAAITGSNGKSTVTTLLGEMARESGCRVAVGGNLGEPALDLLEESVELYVLELSSFQLDSTASLRPKVIALLNISADHMDRYPDLVAYSRSKARICQGAEHLVLNADDALVVAADCDQNRAQWFSLNEPGRARYGIRHISEKLFLCRGDESLLATAKMSLPGRHNWANALAAWAMADVLGIEDEIKRQVLQAFPGLPHRTALVAEHRRVRWYNDSKGTNVGATLAALKGFSDPQHPNQLVLIAGGDCKEADFGQLAETVRQTCRAVVLIGRDAPAIEAVLQGQVKLLRAKDMAEAVRLCDQEAQAGDSVLLSPACASFDMFDNYQHRGDVFTRLVGALIHG